MKINEIEQILNPLVGSVIEISGKKGRMIRWEKKDVLIKITTDRQDICILNQDIKEALANILIEDGNALSHISIRDAGIIGRSSSDLQKILMDNITKVQKDKSYIPQAQEINNAVKSMIELAKTEIEALKVNALLNRRK